MKLFKKLSVIFTFIFCAGFLFACGSNPPEKTQLDYAVSVNTQGSYQEISDKSEITQYTSDTGANKIEVANGFKFSMSMNMDMGEGTSVTTSANAIFVKKQNAEFEMGIKINISFKDTESPIPFTIVATMFKPNTNFYMSTSAYGQTESYYFTQADIDSGDASVDDFSGIQDFDFNNALAEINTLVETDNSIISKSETIENNKTITKFKIVVPSNEVGGHANTAILIFENNVFTGMYYSMDILGLITNVNLVPYSGNIEYPSFNGYKHISEMPNMQ
ncbi:MAG: hypothetical protein IJB10_05255 [Clostridia bacterium]|nr:hypothetical protein [Clostridia bacterium]